jgi:hypothetical protein
MPTTCKLEPSLVHPCEVGGRLSVARAGGRAQRTRDA